MRRNDLLKRDDILTADLLSEIVLLASGVAILVAFLMVIAMPLHM